MSRHGTLTPHQPPPREPPEWLAPTLVTVVAVASVPLLILLGWPFFALLCAGSLFGLGVVVGYKGARREDLIRNIERWLR